MVILIATTLLFQAGRRLVPAPARNEPAMARAAATEGSIVIGGDPRVRPITTRSEDRASRRPAPRPESTGDASRADPGADRARGVQATSAPPAPVFHAGGPPAQVEARLGRELHELITARHKVLQDNALQYRLERAAAPLIPYRPGTNPPLRFTMVDSEEPFAFSGLGGYLYVSRGLFHLVRNDSELQFVLGCEIAHMDLGHLRRAAMANPETEPLSPGRRLYRQIAVGYNPDDVFTADAWSYRTLRQIGVPGYRIIAWLSPSATLEGAEDPRGSRRSPRTGIDADVQEIENYWHSLPPAADRYERLVAFDRAGEAQVSAAARHPSH
jgi:hypothetical protein